MADGWLVYVVRILDARTEHARYAVDTDDVGLGNGERMVTQLLGVCLAFVGIAVVVDEADEEAHTTRVERVYVSVHDVGAFIQSSEG